MRPKNCKKFKIRNVCFCQNGEGYSLVSEISGHCLSIYDPEGNKIHTVGNLKNPHGTALDPRDGSVFIANYGANTVLKYCVNI